MSVAGKIPGKVAEVEKKLAPGCVAAKDFSRKAWFSHVIAIRLQQ
jgi:hypothetical protein